MTHQLGTRHALVSVVLLLLTSCAAVESRAQTLTDTTVVPIEGITVTGSRTPESVLRTPAAISIVGRDRIASTRQISLADGLARVPGVFSQSRGGAQDVRITIRGYGARGNGERSNAGNMRGIRVLTDGVPLTEPDGRTSLELVDLGNANRVEVLRSNGSVLYGNASGGVVNIRTALDFESPWAEYQQRVGEFGFHREQGIVGYAVGRTRGLISVYGSKLDGWRKHSGSATTSIQNRLSVPLDDETRLGLLLDFVSNFNRFPGALTEAQVDANPQQADSAFAASNRDERRFNRVGRIGLSLEREREGGQRLTLATWLEPKVLQRSERSRFRDFNRYHVGGNATWQIQTPFASSWRAVWSAGADDQFQDGSINFYNITAAGERGTTLIANKREGANSAGGFAQVEVRNDAWSFRGAARYDNLWYISEDRIDPTINATKHFTQVTPKGSIARMFERHTVYASVGGGVEAPAFNEIDPPPTIPPTSLNPLLEPMVSTGYELGAKGMVVDAPAGIGRIDYDVAVYSIDIRNDIVPWGGGAYFYTAGESRRRGAEVGLDWTPWPKLTLGGALTVSDNEYVKYTNDIDNFDGNDVAGLPKTLFDSEARWRVVQGLSLALTFKHVGPYFADDENTAETEPADVLGAGAEWARVVPFGRVRVFVTADNLTDVDYVSSVFINGIGSKYFEPGLPRNVSGGVSVSLR